MGVLLAVDDNGLLPKPLGLEVLLVLRLGGVKLGEAVALVIGSDIEDREVVLATNDEGTLNDGVVALAVDRGAAKEVLARTLQAGVEATNEVVGHESQGKLVVVLVVNAPDRVLLERNVRPEPLESLGGLGIGELTLPLVERERRAG